MLRRWFLKLGFCVDYASVPVRLYTHVSLCSSQESTPASASADASSSHGAAAAESMVFESKPQESKARTGTLGHCWTRSSDICCLD